MKKINTFWNWFQDNNQTIKNLINETPKNQKHIAFWINKNLNYYCREIDFIIVFPKKENSKAEFIITANGNKNYFHELITLVDNAPLLNSWKFTAFIQPTTEIDKMMKGLDDPYIFQDITLKISELKFKPILYDENIKKMDIMIFLKNYNLLCDTKTLKQAIYVILQELLGEERLHQKISLVQLAQMTNKEEDLIQLYELQRYLDSFLK
ncbi:hypothetical protein SAMN05444395_11126 [Flavobacterium fryxellicola]|uniref:Uncharacterized protein n=1 Tax=Flavobacterium fryxellicola TaxID=249352 RepID=A0A167ZNE5_9FLAO|nr:hypothetical protein [Flavobacterium fryxellicola]OAB30620.1 hypothetical protein FBFR_01750 [Flavobacterium fryxellicola]SHN76921.1 hypothetical protein SAMN05444395_11126 [Flavobacterium fryxellicola]